MKKRFSILMRTLLVFCLVFAVSCGGDDGEDGVIDPDKSVADPEGTVALSMRSSGNGNTYLSPPECSGSVYIGSDDNFNGSSWEFSRMTEMKGLGNITSIPGSNWASEVAVTPGYGYVAVNVNTSGNRVTYMRMYIMDYIVSTAGGIIGAEVKYQVPFNGNATKMTITKDDDNVFTVTPAVSWSVSSDAAWCKVNVISKNTFKMTLDDKAAYEGKEATITVKSEGLEDVTYKVSQTPFITVSESTFDSPNTSNNKYFSISSNITWEAASSQEWCKITYASGNTGTSQLSLNIEENFPGKAVREAIITLKGKGDQASVESKITIKQAAGDKPAITLEKELLEVANTSSSNYIYLASNIPWTATSDKDWCTISPVSGNGNTNTNLTVSISANTTETKREAIITVKGSGDYSSTESKLKITQEAFYFGGGSGSAANPYQIKTAQHLDNMRKSGSGYFILMNNIDLKSFLQSKVNGWEPITINNTNSLYLDGKGYKITGIWINSSAQNVGLFGSGSVNVSNLNIEIASGKSITGSNTNITSNTYVGGIIGLGSGYIRNCSVKGAVHAYSLESQIVYVGAITGYNSGSKMSNCTSSGSVSGKGYNVFAGGIGGYLYAPSNCSSTATVSAEASKDKYVGQITGNLGY
ncbi:DUF5036 domain-containing protein [Dysgonomonas sp. 521]|uniref:DUF5036 family protein n=1 Tax=Dysgonomonas sp. 521 TaxID=2302932 RepID=UPI0013D4B362|nr:DUF5036 family protein [Dysgonomonas sp. 521]NDV96742.1 DUF5036 domain-containing protein [Dysgonomonas sp. 521]